MSDSFNVPAPTENKSLQTAIDALNFVEKNDKGETVAENFWKDLGSTVYEKDDQGNVTLFETDPDNLWKGLYGQTIKPDGSTSTVWKDWWDSTFGTDENGKGWKDRTGERTIQLGHDAFLATFGVNYDADKSFLDNVKEGSKEIGFKLLDDWASTDLFSKTIRGEFDPNSLWDPDNISGSIQNIIIATQSLLGNGVKIGTVSIYKGETAYKVSLPSSENTDSKFSKEFIKKIASKSSGNEKLSEIKTDVWPSDWDTTSSWVEWITRLGDYLYSNLAEAYIVETDNIRSLQKDNETFSKHSFFKELVFAECRLDKIEIPESEVKTVDIKILNRKMTIPTGQVTRVKSSKVNMLVDADLKILKGLEDYTGLQVTVENGNVTKEGRDTFVSFLKRRSNKKLHLVIRIGNNEKLYDDKAWDYYSSHPEAATKDYRANEKNIEYAKLNGKGSVIKSADKALFYIFEDIRFLDVPGWDEKQDGESELEPSVNFIFKDGYYFNRMN